MLVTCVTLLSFLRRHLADAGAAEALVRLLRSGSAAARSAAAVTLARLAAGAEAREAVGAAHAVPALLAGLQEQDARGLEGATLCLEKLVTMQSAAEEAAHETVRLAAAYHVDQVLSKGFCCAVASADCRGAQALV